MMGWVPRSGRVTVRCVVEKNWEVTGEWKQPQWLTTIATVLLILQRHNFWKRRGSRRGESSEPQQETARRPAGRSRPWVGWGAFAYGRGERADRGDIYLSIWIYFW